MNLILVLRTVKEYADNSIRKNKIVLLCLLVALIIVGVVRAVVYNSMYAQSHVGVAVVTPTPGATCSPATDISIPFSFNGTGTYCWRLQATPTLRDPSNYSNYINSWNLQTLTVTA